MPAAGSKQIGRDPMPVVSLSSAIVHYTEQGQGTPLVLLHANPGDSKDFDAVIPTLAQHWHVLALDWPGYGQSSLTVQTGAVGALYFYRVLREFLEVLKLPPAIFIGNSLGGNTAARLAADHPELVRGLVLVAPGGFTPPDLVASAFCTLQASRLSLPPALFARLYLRRNTVTTRAMLSRAGTTQSEHARLTLNRAIWRSFGTAENDLRTVARAVAAPTLLMFGRSDPVISAKKDGRFAAAAIPHAKFVALPCGHAPFAEVPELFLAQTQAFLAALR